MTAATALIVFGGLTFGALALTSTHRTAPRMSIRRSNDSSHTLFVAKEGEGTGTVTSDPAGIDCGSTCSATFSADTIVTLTAKADTGSTFKGWKGDCEHGESRQEAYISPTCKIKMDESHMVEAYFEGQGGEGSTLSVAKGGDGTGTVTSDPAGIDCGSTCSHTFDPDALVTLTATPDTGMVFKGWTGDCRDDDKSRNNAYVSNHCTVKMDENHMVMAFFDKAGGDTSTLTVIKAGDGSGTVTSDPSGIDCSATCSHDFTTGTKVTLTAKADSGSFFKGWKGDCEGGDRSRMEAYQNDTCTIELDHSHHVVAVFGSGSATSALTVSKGGNGSGTVTSDPAGIDCGSTCSHDYPTDTEVTLTAKAAQGSVFKTWGGDCEGGDRALAEAYNNPTCKVEIEHDVHVNAIFVSKTSGHHHHHHHGGKHHGHHHHHHGGGKSHGHHHHHQHHHQHHHHHHHH